LLAAKLVRLRVYKKIPSMDDGGSADIST